MMMIHLIEWKVFDWFDNAALLISRKKGLIQSNRSLTDDQRAIPWSFSAWFGKRFSIFDSFIKSTHREVYLIWSFFFFLKHASHTFIILIRTGVVGIMQRSREIASMKTAHFCSYTILLPRLNYIMQWNLFRKTFGIPINVSQKPHTWEPNAATNSIFSTNMVILLNRYVTAIFIKQKNSYFNVNCFGNMYWRRRCYFKPIRYSLFADSTTWITHVFMVSGFNLNRMQLRSHMLSN